MYQDSQRNSGRSLVSHRLQVRNKTPQPEIPNPRTQLQVEERQNSDSSSLPCGTSCNVYITHIEDGPYSFSVQLKNHSEEIQPKIDSMCSRNSPRLNIAPLLPGSTILGRSRTDSKFRRAFVMNVKANACKVYYMDYGTTEELPPAEIYALPPMIRDLAQPQAMGFCLAGLQSVTLPESSKEIFAKLVLNKQVLLRVTQNELGSLTQCCEMFLDGKNVTEMLINIVSPLEYTNQFPPRGREIPVNVSFVDCPTQFFVQYHSEIRILGMIQDSLAEFCPNQERLQNLGQVNIGSPIGTLYSVDNMWYRALVIGINDDTVNVLYVDYGNRDNVRVDQLCHLNRNLVTKWRSQAVECCLIGYENATPDSVVAEEMENRVLGGHFTLKLKYLLGGNRLVVDLLHENGTSIVKLMNDFTKKINQASPDALIPSSKLASGGGYAQTPSAFPLELDHSRGSGGDVGEGEGRDRDRFGGGYSRGNTTGEARNYQRQYNKYSEHDDRFLENYDDCVNKGPGSASLGDRPKKKWEDRNGGKRRDEGISSNWREESRRNEESTERSHRFGGGNDNWEGGKSKDRLDRRSGVGERKEERGSGNRYNGNTERSRFSEGRRSGSGKWDDNKDDEKSNDRSEKYRGGERRERFGGGGGGERGAGGNRYSNRDENDEKNSEHGSTGESKYGSGSRYGGNRAADRGGNRKFSGEYDNKFGDRKFNDRGDKSGGVGRFGNDGSAGDRSNRREQGDRGKGGRRNNEKKSFDNTSKPRDTPKTPTTPLDDVDVWDDEAAPAPVPTDKTKTTVTCSVREYPTMNIVAGESYSVCFSVMGNEANDVYVQMESSLSLLYELREQIDAEEASINSNLSSRTVPKELITPGLPLLARFAEDQLLYRAVVRSYTSGLVNVLFVDFGNYAQVPITDLYTVTPELAKKPIQALRVVLNDIKPVSEKWEKDQSIYIQYYENDVLTLKVNIIKCIDSEIVINGALAIPDGKTVSEKLIEEGLALSSNETLCKTSTSNSSFSKQQVKEDSPPPKKSSERMENLNLLLGQQLYAEIQNVVKKNSFVLKICAADKIVECDLDDDRTISDISVDTKVIVVVSGVVENTLLVSLYSLDGNQLGESSTESSNTISPICPMPVVNKTDLVYISHFNNEMIYIQCSSAINDITSLLECLFNHYNDMAPEENKQWMVGSLCCVLSEDGNWYRAKIINIENDKYTVMFIDYGNTEQVGEQQIRLMDKQFFTAEFSLAAYLPVEWIVENPPLMEYVGNEEFICSYNKDQQSNWSLDLTFVSTGEKLVAKLVDESIATAKQLPMAVKPSLPEMVSLEVGSSVQVIVSHVDTPTMFWVQQCSDINTIEELQQKLQDCIECMSSPSDDSKVFAAKYPEDEMWYRAIASGEGDTVRFIDYGNTDPAPMRKELPIDLRHRQEGYAIPMYLCVKPNSDKWSEEAIKLFETFIEQPITAEIVSVDLKTVVDLKSNGQCLSKLLVEGKHGNHINNSTTTEVKSIPVATVYEVLILAIIDINNFYVQFVCNSDKQIEMMGYLANARKFEKLDDCIIGDLIAAQYSLDGQWYRAKIISLNPLRALFIDYGNSSDITEYRDLPDHLKMHPPMAIHCSLGLENSQGRTEHFAYLTNDATQVFHLIFKRKGEPNIVELKIGEEININEILTSEDQASKIECASKVVSNCSVCHANGPYDFYIHTPPSQGLAEDILEQMAEAAMFPKVDKLEKEDIVAVLSPEDDCWYRCKIVDTEPEIGGFFIDFGNGTLVTEYRCLPEELRSIPPLAVKCSLSLPDGIGGWSADAVLTFTELINENVHGFDVLIFSEDDPWVVELIVNDAARTKVTEELLKLCPAATPVPSKPATRAASPIVADIEKLLAEAIKSAPLPECEPMISSSRTSSGSCYVTHVNSSSDFYIRDSSKCEDLEKVALALTEFGNNPQPELDTSKVGDLVAAAIEGEFFRAKILEINPLKVSLIDIGNTSETSMILSLPESIKNIPNLVKNCKLHIPEGHEILNQKKLEEEFVYVTTSNIEFSYRVISEQDQIPEIELSLDGSNLIDKLNNDLKNKQLSVEDIEKLFKNVKEPTFKISTSIKVTLPYVKSLNEFYIQEISSDIDRIANELLKADTFKLLTERKVGDLVAACCLEDSAWYRAEILNTSPLEVKFVDFGNISTVDEVRELPKELFAIPHKCKLGELTKPEDITEWDEEAGKKFAKICEESSEFSCEIVSQEEGSKLCKVRLSTIELGDLSTLLAKRDVANDERKNCLEDGDIAAAEVKLEKEIDTSVLSASGSAGEDIPEVSTNIVNAKEGEVVKSIEENDQSLKKNLSQENISKISEDNKLLEDKTTIILDSTKSQKCSYDGIVKSQKKIIEEPKKKERTPAKIKSLAEIKANAKSRIVTRSTSVVTSKSGRNSPSPVPKPKSADVTKKSSEKTPLRRSVSFEDKIIPGCVSGNEMMNDE